MLQTGNERHGNDIIIRTGYLKNTQNLYKKKKIKTVFLFSMADCWRLKRGIK